MLTRLMLIIGLLVIGGCLPTPSMDASETKRLVAKMLPWCNETCSHGIENPAWPSS